MRMIHRVVKRENPPSKRPRIRSSFLNKIVSWRGRNKTRDQRPGPKSGTKFCQPNMGIKHACIKLKFMSNVDYRLFL